MAILKEHTLSIISNIEKFKINGFLLICLCLLFLLQPGISVYANTPVSLKNLGSFNIDKPVYLTGYGLVVGLAGTGDGRGAPQTNSALANLSTQMGLQTSASELKSKNAASVIVTATASSGAHDGDLLDVTLSSLGDAKSLAGGTLIRSFLSDMEGNKIAVAQGEVSVGGYAFSSGSGGSMQKNHPSVGKIPNGALLLEDLEGSAVDSIISYRLHDPDPALLARIRSMVETSIFDLETEIEGNNLKMFIGNLEPGYFVAMVETLEVITNINPRVVINEKTGTVVIGGDVKISPCAVAHGDLVIEITTFPEVSQPMPFSDGQTFDTWNDSLFVSEDAGRIFTVGGEASVQELIHGLNVLGVNPRDIIAIFQAIKRAGALHADLVVM